MIDYSIVDIVSDRYSIVGDRYSIVDIVSANKVLNILYFLLLTFMIH